MSNLIHNYFILLLISLSDFSPNYVYKNLEFFNSIVEKSLKFFSYNIYIKVTFNFPLILLLIILDIIFQRSAGKKSLIIVNNSGIYKVIFILLTEVVIFHVQFTLTYIKCLFITVFCVSKKDLRFLV